MKTKFGLAALDAIQKNYKIILDRLIKGYEKVTGKQPEGIDLTMIKREAYEKAEESAKVVDMEGKTLDPSKPIMGGKQQVDEGFSMTVLDEKGNPTKTVKTTPEGIMDTLQRPGAKKSYEIMEESLGVRLYGDVTFEELMKIKETGMHPRGEPPIKKADGGRINFALGGPTGAGLQGIIGADLNPLGAGALGALGDMEEEDEFAGIQGQTAGFGLFGAASKALQGLFGSKVGSAIFENYVRRPAINKSMEGIKKANQIAYQKRLELEEKIRQASALKAAQKEIERMGYTEYGSGGGRDASLNLGPGGSYTGMGDVGATTANTTGDFATDSISYDLKDGGLATMFVERR